MGLKLRLLSLWTPQWFQKKGLDELTHSTVQGLQEVFLKETPEFEINSTTTSKVSKIIVSDVVLEGNLEERRRCMAKTHNELVETMIKIMGRDETISMGREAMSTAGLSLGQKFKRILGVGESVEELIMAAKILYKVLGIDFTIKKTQKDGLVMVVHHCFLSEYYTPDTCLVLSAADEGVVQGLNPNIKINFTERITEGCLQCLAPITVHTKEGLGKNLI